MATFCIFIYMKRVLTEEQKLVKAAWQKEYRSRSENKAKKKERQSTPEYKEWAKNYNKKYSEINKEEISKKKKEYRSKPEVKVKSLERSRKYRSTPEGRAKELERNSTEEAKKKKAESKKIYREKNRDILNEKQKLYAKKPEIRAKHKYRMETDVQYMLTYCGRQRRRKALRAQSVKGQSRYKESLGCTVEFFKKYIESLWLPEMSWENHGLGRGKWHLDEIKPCAAFDLSDPEQYKACFHYTNCQPLWESDNIRKSSWYEGVRHRHKQKKK